jgi:hypothetical protein
MDARRRLRSIAIEAEQLDGGRVANRLSAYAVLIQEHPEHAEEMCAELERLEEVTPDVPLAELLRESCQVMREVIDG